MRSCFSVKRCSRTSSILIRLGAAVIPLSFGASSFGQCEIDELFPLDGQREDRVGWASAVSGNVALLGAPWDDDNGTDSGSAYFYRYDPDVGQWLAEAKILEPDGMPYNEFGSSVGVDGNLAIIAAPSFPVALHGVAYIFRYDEAAETWIEEALLTASDGVDSDDFGLSVAIDGDVVILGAPRRIANTSGRAYIFRYDPKQSSWIEEAILLSSAPYSDDWFGYSVDIDGDVAIVAMLSGGAAALVYRRDPATGQWVQEGDLTDNTFLGWSVAISEDVALLADPGDSANGDWAGATFVYRFCPAQGTWQFEQRLFASDAQEWDSLGWSVAIEDDLVILSAPQWVSHGIGAAYVYRYDPDQREWFEQAKLQPADGTERNFFGRSVAISDGIALIGATGDIANGSGSGSGYLFDLKASPADLDCNGTVGASDLLVLLASWGPCPDCDPPSACLADLDGDCTVGTSDLIVLLGDWG